VYPIIAPPTPPQLQQDKQAIDDSFTKAFDLLDQLVKDTEELKQAEKARTERLDAALEGVTHATGELKASIKDREDDSRRMNDDIKNLRDLIPKAMEAQKDQADERLKGLNAELKSLKTLISTRMAPRGSPATTNGANGSTSTSSGPNMNGTHTSEDENSSHHINPSGQTSISVPPIAPGLSSTWSDFPSSFGRPVSGNRASIPSWQMAAAQKNSTGPEAPSVEEASN
jgi:peroxin-14